MVFVAKMVLDGEDDRVTDDIDGVFDGLVTIKECSSED